MWRLVSNLSQAWQIQSVQEITERQFKRNVAMRNERKGRILGGALLAMTLSLGAVNLQAQESRKVLSNPVPAYPEVARRMHLTGVVKVQVVISADGRVKEKNVIGGPTPGTGNVRIEVNAAERSFLQVFKPCGVIAEINVERGEFEFLFQFSDRNRCNRCLNAAFFRAM